MLIYIVQHLHIFYLFSRIALGLIEAKRVKLEYMSNCLCHWFSTRYNFPPSAYPQKTFGNVQRYFWLSQLDRGTIHIQWIERRDAVKTSYQVLPSTPTPQNYGQPKMSVVLLQRNTSLKRAKILTSDSLQKTESFITPCIRRIGSSDSH